MRSTGRSRVVIFLGALVLTLALPAHSQTYTFSTLAGTAGTPGSANGTGSAAQFRYPGGLAVDSAGNVYVADTYNCTVRKITTGGVVTTLAGLAGTSGTNDGTGTGALFNFPNSVAVDTAGNVYVADTFSCTIRKITPLGVVTTLAGLANKPGSNDGSPSVARFYNPYGVAVDGAGNVYVADSYAYTIRKVTSAGTVSTLAGSYQIPGTNDGASALFYFPLGVAAGHSGNVYVADSGNFTVREITSPGGTAATTTLAGLAGTHGSVDGTGSGALFGAAQGVAVDNGGNVYVADTTSSTIRQILPTALVTTLAGLAGTAGSTDGAGSSARFNKPGGVAVDNAGNIYVADSYNHTIRVGTVAGSDLDIGLRVFDGHSTVKIAMQVGTPTSSLRISKGGTNYGVQLVGTTDANASRIHMQTSTGVMAWKALP